MNIDFEVGTKVFHIIYGWGEVKYQYTVQWDSSNVKDSDLVCQVRFKSGEDVHFTKQMVRLLSTKEYSLNGQTLQPFIDYRQCEGKWGLFWGDNEDYEDTFILSRLDKYESDEEDSFYVADGTSYGEFYPLPQEVVDKLKLDERGHRSSN